ncbi:3-carboxymuconate cyclase [Massariosphaeria phaeospora]|uniref:3-carboxymuconate cyclase n=1 Tax=Massariosphaeria phaeospora TaxID=100035 RepID=A0A7C8M3I7_9PLEO|nr:3-carboxymuconate cyclase [Massariosphaeria phaeospora]
MAFSKFLLSALAGSASAAKLYVATYNNGTTEPALGGVTTLEFTPGLAEGAGSLKTLGTNQECGSAPTWLDTSLGAGKVVCVDEGFATPNASFNILGAVPEGLKAQKKQDTIQGPVHTKFYNNNTVVALAHFAAPGPEQLTSHVHQAVQDPTGKYLVFPDLGADLVRVYCICPQTGKLTVHKSLESTPGYGPRHVVFWSPGHQNTNSTTTYMFVIHELSNKIVSYRVGYLEAGGLTFEPVHEVTTYGDRDIPAGAKAAEIAVTPDNAFIIASNRNATIDQVANPNPTNETKIDSDTLATYKPSPDGKLSFVQLKLSGGKFPRHFSLNKDGSLIAVANQLDMAVDIYARDLATGMIGDKVAGAFGLPGPVTNVVWGEE